MKMQRIAWASLTWLLVVMTLLTACEQMPPATPTPLPPTVVPSPTDLPTPEPPSVEPPEGYSWWNQDVFYEIFVRSFFDSDGDGKGDFNGLVEKIDYLNDGDPDTSTDLGIQGIWLMPIFPSPSYHGYDVTDYTAINPDYGTMEDFTRFLEEAHQRGIRVILDLPLNHTSSEHPWFLDATTPDSAHRDYYIWSESDPAYLGPWNQDVWHEGPQGGYYYGVFWSGMPDLNYTNPAVVEEMNEVVKFWLNLGVDGFRLDGARYIVEDGEEQADTPATHAYYQQLRQVVKEANPDALLLGEVWTDNFTVSTYTKGEELDLAFNFEQATAMMSSALTGNSQKARNALTFTLKLFPQGSSAPFLTNHDMDRVMSALEGDVDKAKNAAAMLLSAPGVPFIYYGEEIGMSGKRGNANDDIQRRLPMQWNTDENAGFTIGTPWTPVYPFHGAANVAVQDSNPDSLLSFYRNWIHLRNQSPALLFGDTLLVESESNAVYALVRSTGTQTLLVLINLSDEPLTDYALNLKKGALSGSYSLEALYGEGNFANLDANPEGGFNDYLPLLELPANSQYMLELIPQN